MRSFLIKLGAIAGAGIALGTVYALTRGTSSTPPGAK
jgi:xanthosine utilization system XapX-like protein